MSGLDFLSWYLTVLPFAIVADALLLTGGVALLTRWRRHRRFRGKFAPYSHYR